MKRLFIPTLLALLLLGPALRAADLTTVPALPDDPACTAQDRAFMSRAYEIARSAVKHGNHPFGALLVKEGKVLLEFENCIYTSADVTKHAETGLISAATPKFDYATLNGVTLYTSTEPCIMCCGAIRWSGVRRIVYGTTSLQLTRVIGRPIPAQPLEIREIFARTDPTMAVSGPLMEAEGLLIHVAYWPNDPVYGKKKP